MVMRIQFWMIRAAMGMKGSVTICSWCHRLPVLLTGLKLQQPARTVTSEEVSVAEADTSL